MVDGIQSYLFSIVPRVVHSHVTIGGLELPGRRGERWSANCRFIRHQPPNEAASSEHFIERTPSFHTVYKSNGDRGGTVVKVKSKSDPVTGPVWPRGWVEV